MPHLDNSVDFNEKRNYKSNKNRQPTHTQIEIEPENYHNQTFGFVHHISIGWYLFCQCLDFMMCNKFEHNSIVVKRKENEREKQAFTYNHIHNTRRNKHWWKLCAYKLYVINKVCLLLNGKSRRTAPKE